jgi:SAM-dependent methyltransferase
MTACFPTVVHPHSDFRRPSMLSLRVGGASTSRTSAENCVCCDGMKIDLGCGPHPPEGWTGVDNAVGARLAKIPLFPWLNSRLHLFRSDWDPRIRLHDLRRPLPWGDDSVDVIYSSHTLEHLSRDEGRAFLGECHRVLRHGGPIRLVVPDVRVIIEDYLGGRLGADELLDSLGVFSESRGGWLKRRLSPRMQYLHRCMYDHPTLQAAMAQAGFEATMRRPLESDIEDIQVVESESRSARAVIMEGRKT